MKSRKELMAECEEFLLQLGRDIPPEERLIISTPKEATVQVDETGKKVNSGFWPAPWKKDKFIPDGTNNYVCISSSVKTVNPKTGLMRYWRGEASFGHGLAIMVDDLGSGKGSKGEFDLEEFCAKLEPTAIVETSPDNFQCWYFFDAPVADMRAFKEFLNSFVKFVLDKGGDNTIKDVARYGRMPVGINNKRTEDGQLKYGDENGEPWRVRLVRADYSLRYSPEDIADAFSFAIEAMGSVRRESSREQLITEAKFDECWYRIGRKILGAMKQGEGSDGEVIENQSGKCRIRCPWGHEHTNGDPFGAYIRGPIPSAEFDYVFGCAHDTCRKENQRTWSAFVDEVVIPRVVDKVEKSCAEGVDGGDGEAFWNGLIKRNVMLKRQKASQ